MPNQLILFVLLMCLFFIIGSCLGSFFSLIVERYDKKENIIFKPSYCMNCKKNLSWWQNIPIFSYLLLKGKCFYCGNNIHVSLLLSEIACGLLTSGFFYFFYCIKIPALVAFSNYIFLMLLFLLSMLDLRYRIVPHEITYSSIILVVLFKYFINHSFVNQFIDLGIAFLFLDLLVVCASFIKKFDVGFNLILVPLIIWTFYSIFFTNIYFIIVALIVYFIFIKFKINLKMPLMMWLVLLILILFQIYKNCFLAFNPEALSFYFIGVGIIYFICEVLFYFFLPKGFNEIDQSENAKVALGGGDITILALISVFLGYKLSFAVLFIASFSAIFSLFVCGFMKKAYVPFVPFLSVAFFIIIVVSHVWKK